MITHRNMIASPKNYYCFFLIMMLLGAPISKSMGQNVSHRSPLERGNLEIPTARNLPWNQHSGFADSIIRSWAAKALKDQGGKTNNPRIYLAKLLTRTDLTEVNAVIQKTKPWGVAGSSWLLNKKGDYDFTETVLITILYMFGEKQDILFPKTRDHLLQTLLTEEGNRFHYKAPRTLGLANETENHLLMTEGSRYLKNQWLKNHGSDDPRWDNMSNGMEEKLSALLRQMSAAGLFEFNSLPYTGYTLTALLNLEAFASENIRKEARAVLDYYNYIYALGSYQYKHYAPMRRRYDKSGFQMLTTDYHSVFMKVWMSYAPSPLLDRNIKGADVHALMAAVMPYRPSDQVVQWMAEKGSGYFVKMGHGSKSGPEIYTAGKHYLISAGGANQGKSSDVVARPTCLFLNDTATQLSEVFHLEGPGKDFMQWNNTGLYEHFACAAGPVHIPTGMSPVVANDIWKIFRNHDGVCVAVHSTDQLGLMMVFEQSDPLSILNQLADLNPNEQDLSKQCRVPGGALISYDVQAPKNRWVIKSVDGASVERDFEQWPLINGSFHSN